MRVGVETETGAGIILQGGVHCRTHKTALLVHLDGVLRGPGDDIVIIGIILQFFGLCLDLFSAGGHLVYHDLQRAAHLISRVAVCLGALAVGDALFHVAYALVGAAQLLEVPEVAAADGQRP